MKVVPSVVYDFKSEAEKKLHRLLSKMKAGSGAVALHSQNLPEHSYKEWCEIDYVLVTRMGVLVLELKGGRISRDRDGIWLYKDRFGVDHRKSEGPFEQASSGKYALKSALENQLGVSNVRDISFGWGCVFPDTVHIPELSETPKESILGAKECKTSETLSVALTRLQKYWFSKKNYYRELSAERIHGIHMALRPSFEVSPALSSRVDSIIRKMVSLTDSQYMIVDAADDCRRLLCTGGAGTGKTLVALEVARREAAKGKRVGFISSGVLFGAYLKQVLAPAGVEFLELELISGKARIQSGDRRFDCLVLDEAQDMMNFELLDILGEILEGGLEDGNWQLFLDPNNQQGLLGNYDEDAFNYVKELSDHSLRLKQNCRNTPQIILQTQLLTGADIGVSKLDGQGEKVILKKFSNSEGCRKLVADQIKSWQMEGAELEEVTLLTFGKFEEAFPDGFQGSVGSKLYELTPDAIRERPKGRLGYCSAAEFKGLESRYIIFAGLESLADDAIDLRKFYIGLTRANALLAIYYPENRQSLIDAFYASNVHNIRN
jgi:hypothetical protein